MSHEMDLCAHERFTSGAALNYFADMRRSMTKIAIKTTMPAGPGVLRVHAA